MFVISFTKQFSFIFNKGPHFKMEIIPFENWKLEDPIYVIFNIGLVGFCEDFSI